MSKITYADVTKALSFIVRHNGVFDVNPDGYVINTGDKEIVKINGENSSKDLMVFMEIINDPNATVLNPFVEGVGQTEDQNWLYSNMNATFTHKVVKFYQFIATVIVNQADKKAKIDISPDLSAFISPFVKMADSKTVKEVTDITKNYLEYISVFYKRKLKVATFRCGLYEGPSFRSKFPKVRKKTWDFLEGVTAALFGLDQKAQHDTILKDMIFKTTVLAYPMCDALFNLYYKLYAVTNEAFSLIESAPDFGFGDYFTVDLTEFGRVLSEFEDYFKLTKHFVQPNMVNETTVTQSNPIAKPVNDSGMPLPTTKRVLFDTVPAQRATVTSDMPHPSQIMAAGTVPAAGPVSSMPMPYTQAVVSAQHQPVQFGPYGGVPGAALSHGIHEPTIIGCDIRVVSSPPELFR